LLFFALKEMNQQKKLNEQGLDSLEKMMLKEEWKKEEDKYKQQ